ncbi:Metallophosphoesterase [Sulfidibacter corallicola]|uniref:Metallophosphoesterase n=1 Tax=Sulfidibacter corallicola TaxID=2818388 RepID=A0A8A4TKU9_SULCO|nr:metallophosphoesterase [Sulfidibacter corallicola]QTD49468.1 metallophosphoesterase [Sulfidibacter corallicola]
MKHAWFLVSVCLSILVPSSAAESADVLSSYVALAWSAKESKTMALARAITSSSQTPPSLTVNGKAVTMTARANPDTTAFPVTVWEAVMPMGAEATLAGTALPVPKSDPQSVAIVGDSGCKSDQGCDQEATWPFPEICAEAATRKPDLVIHVGDYNYRGTPSHSPPGNKAWVYDGCGDDFLKQETKSMPYGDNWETWNLDFFTPAKPLLASSPWAITRGNHELCARAGVGWFYLLEPSSPLLATDYTANPCTGRNAYTMPAYALALDNLNLLMIDTANLCGWALDESEVPTYTKVYARMLALADTDADWLVAHRPLVVMGSPTAAQPVPGITQTAFEGNITMTAVLKEPELKGWAQKIDMMVNGHVHLFQYLYAPQGQMPPEFIVGNSGVRLDTSTLNGPASTTDPAPGGQISLLGSVHAEFGYLLLASDPSLRWTATLHAPNGNILETFMPFAPAAKSGKTAGH